MLSWRREKREEPAEARPQAPTIATPSSSYSGPTAAALAGAAAVPGRSRLGELLVHEGVITQLQLIEAVSKQQQTGSFIGQTLVELGYISQSTLVSFLVKQCKIPHIGLLDYNVSEDLFKLVPKAMCHQYRLLPLDRLGKILTLAMVDPLDAAALEKVRELCPDLRIKPILCTWNHFEQVARKLFTENAQQSAEVSMGSFGLAPKKADASADEKTRASNAVAALVQEVAPARAVAAKPAPPTTAAAAPPVKVTPEPVAPPRVQIPESLFDRMGDRVRQALAESLTPLIAEQQKLVALQLESATGKPADLAREIASSMRASLLEGLAPLFEAHARHIAQAPHAQLDTAALAKDLGESVRAAMLDSVLPALQLGEPADKGGNSAAAPVFDAKEMADHFAQHMDKSMASFAKEMRDAMAAHPAQKHMDEIAGKLARALESSNTAQNDRIAQEAQASNVSPFPGLRAADAGQGNAALPHFDPMEEIGLGVEADDRVRDALLSGRLQRAFTFEAFLSGNANAFTLSVARAVTERFSREFTPFYIYGEVGIGKTHLLQAIGNAITTRDPDLRVAYMTGLRFVSACERATRDQDIEKFRESFAHWDVLLFDDAQSVAAHKQAQDELRAVLGALTMEGRLVVVSADRAPDQLPETSHQLVSRLAAGIVSRLQAPDMPTRVAILQRHARVLKTKIADDILSLIASRVPADVRKMTGALRKALAYAQVSGTEVTHELTEEILSHLTAIEAA